MRLDCVQSPLNFPDAHRQAIGDTGAIITIEMISYPAQVRSHGNCYHRRPMPWARRAQFRRMSAPPCSLPTFAGKLTRMVFPLIPVSGIEMACLFVLSQQAHLQDLTCVIWNIQL